MTLDRTRGNYSEESAGGLRESVVRTILEGLSESLKTPLDDIDRDIPFSDYGIDSILSVGFVKHVNEKLGIQLNTAILFDYTTVDRLAAYILSACKDQLRVQKEEVQVESEEKNVPEKNMHAVERQTEIKRFQRRRPGRLTTEQSQPTAGKQEKESPHLSPIAVIGISGQFPGANDVQGFWENLMQGTDGIKELPSGYLDQKYYSPRKEKGKTYCKWGGILEERDCFDPLFFNLSPREAESMNPHQRLILQESWKGLEDAGYNPRDFEDSRVGIFIGAEPTGYFHESFTGASDAIVASRLSYYLNLKGPALVINTGCSSSAVAIHMACESLRNQESQIALAGGVFAVMDQKMMIGLAAIEMLSPSGRCFTFDQAADGTVFSEGVGMVVLKRLEDAVADGDFIYGVIKGSGVNQDGASNGITAPNGIAQEELITGVYNRFRINPEDISYVEVHGTGTKLGDPVEANALVRAFKKFTGRENYCAIGSVKSHIGHTSASAGVIGLIRVLLSLQHRQIPGLLNFRQLNPMIDFNNSPFFINTEAIEWKAAGLKPRMAALNSFGHSGTNVHLVVEEYTASSQSGDQGSSLGPVLVPLSAKTEESLKSYAEKLLVYLDRTDRMPDRINLEELAYTLQTGREQMKYRTIFRVHDIAALKRNLKAFIEGRITEGHCWTGQTEQKHKELSGEQLKRKIAEEGAESVAALWSEGCTINWKVLYENRKVRRANLPSYPFEKERYWKTETDRSNAGPQQQLSETQQLHPYLHLNTSDFSGYRFSTVFTGEEFIFRDHIVQGRHVLPGMATIELIRAAVVQMTGQAQEVTVRMKHIGWLRPIVAEGEPLHVHIRLIPEGNKEIGFEIWSGSRIADEHSMVHCRGRVLLEETDNIPAIRISDIRNLCGVGYVKGEQLYQKFRTIQFDLGPALQGVQEVYTGSGQTLARLEVPSCIRDSQDQFSVHPVMLDSAMQSGFALTSDFLTEPAIPFAVEEVEIFGRFSPVMWSWVRPSPSNGANDKVKKIDADVFDEQGKICLRMRGFSSRALGNKMNAPASAVSPATDVMLWQQAWEEQNIFPETKIPEYSEHILILCETGLNSLDPVREQLKGVVCHHLQSGDRAIAGRYREYAVKIFEIVQKVLLSKPKGKILIQVLVPAKQDQQLFSGFSGLLRTASLENPLVNGQLIVCDTAGNIQQIIEKVEYNARKPKDSLIFYRNGKRMVPFWNQLIHHRNGGSLPWKDKKVYLITGGMGGIGKIFAKEIAQSVSGATLILTGRSPLDKHGLAELQQFNKNGCTIEYRQTDISEKQAVEKLVNGIMENYGSLHGILHCAGVVRDNFIIRKTAGEFSEVLAPKVSGTVYLDHVTRDLPLDFFVLFSSGAAVLGNPGQADYATANAFMDVYAGYRNSLVELGERNGHTLSVNWPLWKEGGMQVDAGVEKQMMQSNGIIPLGTRSGINALVNALKSGQSQAMVVEGDLKRIQQNMQAPAVKATDEKETEFSGAYSGKSEAILNTASYRQENTDKIFREKIMQYFKNLLSGALKLPPHRIDPTAAFEKYGIDSIMVMQLTTDLEQVFGSLPKTLFFEYHTLQELTDYFLETYPAQLQQIAGVSEKTREQNMQPFNTSAIQNTAPVQNLSKPALLETNELKEQALDYFRKLLSTVLKLPAHRIAASEPFEKFGIDSILVMQLTGELEKVFGSLPKTLFFEYHTLAELTEYFLETYEAKLHELFGKEKAHGKQQPFISEMIPAAEILKQADSFTETNRSSAHLQASDSGVLDIAIIGISGRYPEAENLQEYWKNLAEGKDCITEVPADRWDWKEFFTEDRTRPGHHYSNRGGFIKDVDKFDPLFFNITPREAEVMDPQERLFLEHVWMALEDAGLRKEDLQGDAGNLLPAKVGVYAGLMFSEYQLYGADIRPPRLLNGIANIEASIANRISYVLNLHGPSMTIGTMCSSALTTIHLACQDLKLGKTNLAIAGGVNVSVHPNKYLMLSKAQFISVKGRCESFGEGGEGYIPGEGVGVVLLKRLADAERDGDRIYGVIKGSAINHGGKTNGYTVPNPRAQQMVIKEALLDSGIDPATISYIEAHGTGTRLGDPIEINGLSKAFGFFTQEKQYCYIGSAKSNIGHCEAAAGIAGVSKIVLQMMHRKIAPSLHSATLNPNIDFASTPFIVNQKLREWTRPVINGMECPLRAGISSFGAGGSNAHIIIEEYIPATFRQPEEMKGPFMVVLSARSRERLEEYSGRLLRFVREQIAAEQPVSLTDLAYTLQVGREAMEERLGLLVSSLKELGQKLQSFLEGKEEDGICLGQINREKDTLSAFAADEDLGGIIDNWIRQGKYIRLLDLWVKGFNVDWNRIYGEKKPGKISLPTYPFARQRFWVPDKVKIQQPAQEEKYTAKALHPLIDANESGLKGLKFTKKISGEEFFLKDHVVKGELILPGVAHLEMAFAAGNLAGETKPVSLSNIIWGYPIRVEKDFKEVEIKLIPSGHDQVEYVIQGAGEKTATVYSQGKIRFGATAAGPQKYDIPGIRSRCSEKKVKSDIYASLKAFGFDYGPAFQLTDELYGGPREALSRLVLPQDLKADFNKYTLHPSVLDAALRTGFGMILEDEKDTALRIPFSLEEVTVFDSIPDVCYCHATVNRMIKDGELSTNISILNEEGLELVRVTGLVAKPFGRKAPGEILYFKQVWNEKNNIADNSPRRSVPGEIVLLLDNNSQRVAELRSRWSKESIQVRTGEAFREINPDEFIINDRDPQSYRQLLTRLAELNKVPEAILCLWSADFYNASADETKGYGDELTTDLYRQLYLFQVLTATGMEKEIHCLYVFPYGSSMLHAAGESVSGFAKSLTTVNHLYRLTSIQPDKDALETQTLISILSEELKTMPRTGGQEIRFVGGKRYEREIEAVSPGEWMSAQGIQMKEQGVYVITGGAGGLGLIFSLYLSRKYQARLVLIGRSELNEEKAAQINALEGHGAEVMYLRADITKSEELGKALRAAKNRFGRIDGVIHSAGLEGQVPATQASKIDFGKVLAPKMQGTINLDALTGEDRLDFFILFSSISAQVGDFGAGCYAAANRFLDSYAVYRNELRTQGKRSGKTLSLNWPFWEEGGLGGGEFENSSAAQSIYVDYSGMMPLPTEEGLQIFEKTFAAGLSQIIIAKGNAQKIYKTLRIYAPGKEIKKSYAAVKTESAVAVSQDVLFAKTEDYLKEKLSEVTQIPKGQIDARTELEHYGIDSVMIMELNRLLGKDFDSIPGTLFFEFKTIHSMTGYFIENYSSRLKVMLQADETRQEEPETKEHSVNEIKNPVSLNHSSGFISVPADKTLTGKPSGHTAATDDIAIIGISGRYPKARNLQEFWKNLQAGLDCIEEIPEQRWDNSSYYDPSRKPGKIYSKWGGFIEGIDEFDPLFFNMAPFQATLADPQHRLFLQASWEAIEDAGYTRESLCNDEERKVGVFVGMMWNEYQLYAEGQNMILSNNASLANQVSYFFDFHGPSMVMDTACSSSLYAIAMACESIRKGASSLALAGGVNVSVHPNKYIGLCQSGFLASDGRCRSFGKGGDGYVPGEGIGCILLKPLSKALEDRDQVYGVIKASVTNHGGKTNGATVPNPNAQAALISQAIEEAGISPEQISYMEAHGTGTELGDPIEVRALTKAFRKYTDKKQFCAIGSVKSNVGHLEGAAGVVAVTKVLLQMKHRKLVPSLHSGELNPIINFENSPFTVQRELSDWKRPLLKKEGVEYEYPRMAGISAFGAGGSNAHILIQEFIPASDYTTTSDREEGQPALIVLSARKRDRLEDYARSLHSCLQDNGQEFRLSQVAFTLQTGREAMEERLAIVAASVKDLEEKLQKFLDGKAGEEEGIFYGRIKRTKGKLEVITPDEELQEAVEKWIQKKKLQRLADMWVKGLVFDWNRLYHSAKPVRMSLPTYPFARESYWLPEKQLREKQKASIAAGPLVTVDGTFPEKKEEVPSVTPKQWLFSREEWVEEPLPPETDWKTRMKHYSGKRVCIVYNDRSDKEALSQLIKKVEAAADVAQPVVLQSLHVSDITTGTLKAFLPEVILFLGPVKKTSYSVLPAEAELQHVYTLTQSLMHAAAGDAVRIYYLYEGGQDAPRVDMEALSGFVKSALRENQLHVWKSIRHYDTQSSVTRHQLLLTEWLADEPVTAGAPDCREVQYLNGKRSMKYLVETSLSPAPEPVFRKGGTYILAGGMGYVGDLLCQKLAKEYQATLILLSRGSYNETRKEQCSRLEALGATVHYHSVDISDPEAMKQTYGKIKQQVKEIHGVINLARAHESKGIAVKPWESFYSISQVKIMGTILLDELTREEPLDFFMLFASIGAYGARGDSDYAYSVAFQNAFSYYRNRLMARGERKGTSVTQCWGPWMEDKLFPESRARMKAFGFDLIDMDTAFPVIEATCWYKDSVIGIINVTDAERVRKGIGIVQKPGTVAKVPASAALPEKAEDKVSGQIAQWERDRQRGIAISFEDITSVISVETMSGLDTSLVERIHRLCFSEEVSSGVNTHPQQTETVEKEPTPFESGEEPDDIAQIIREIVSEVLQIDEVDMEESFQNYGVDSIVAMQLTTRLEKKLKQEIQPQWLLEFPTVKALSTHLIHQNQELLA
jgi:polyketide synthase PksN